eukprot:2314965-Rhodomonas_salina.3
MMLYPITPATALPLHCYAALPIVLHACYAMQSSRWRPQRSSESTTSARTWTSFLQGLRSGPRTAAKTAVKTAATATKTAKTAASTTNTAAERTMSTTFEKMNSLQPSYGLPSPDRAYGATSGG